MRAMILDALGPLTDNPAPLRLVQLPDPVPAEGELLIEVHTCGVCHTELDEIEGRTPPPRLPIVLGHQVVGRVAALGAGSGAFRLGDRVGVAWIFSADGTCEFCRSGAENLCEQFRATGRVTNGSPAGAPRLMLYDLDTFEGHSGSPVWLRSDNFRNLVGIHTGPGSDVPGEPAHVSNRAVRVTEDVMTQVRAWMRL